MYKYKSLQAGQLPQEKIEKIDDLSICVDLHNLCSLSISGDIKICQCHVIKRYDVTTPNGEVFYQLLSQSCFYCPNLITVAPCNSR